MSDQSPKKRTRQVIDANRLVNLFRAERGLPRANRSVPVTATRPRITRQTLKDIFIQVCKDPQSRVLTDADFELGVLIAKLVEQEVDRRIAILKGELVPLGGKCPK